MIISLGITTGVIIFALTIRVLSILLHLRHGIRRIPENWMKIMMCEDLFHTPELIPGLKRSSAVKELSDVSEAHTEQLLKFVIMSAWLPTIFYRFALKATFWFYWPLVFLVGKGKLHDNSWRKAWTEKRASPSEIVAFIFAVLTLSFSIIFLAIPELSIWIFQQEQYTPVAPINWLLLLDWNQLINEPWRWFSITNCIISIVLFLWLGGIRTYQQSNTKLYQLDGWQIASLITLKRLSTILFIVYWLVAAYYLTLFNFDNDNFGSLTPYVEKAIHFLNKLLPFKNFGQSF